MRRRSALPVVALLAAGSLAGCGSGTSNADKSPSSSSSASSSAGSSPTGSASSSPSTGGPSDAVSAGAAEASGFPRDRTEAASLHKAVLVRNAATTPEEHAVVAAWMAYWQGAADAYYYYRPSRQFTAVASGAARTSVLSYLDSSKAKKQRVVGWARDNVLAVSVDGDTAKLRDCTENYTFTVDQEAEPLTRPTPFYDTTGVLKKVDGRWLVVHENSREARKSCLG